MIPGDIFCNLISHRHGEYKALLSTKVLYWVVMQQVMMLSDVVMFESRFILRSVITLVRASSLQCITKFPWIVDSFLPAANFGFVNNFGSEFGSQFFSSYMLLDIVLGSLRLADVYTAF